MPPVNPQLAEDTIVAISTPPGVGAIAVVRLSGPQAVAICDRLFEGAVRLRDATPRFANKGHIVSASTGPIDEVLVTVFRGPNSYTGEDMVEISCHGGALPASLVLGAAMEAGARPAGPGEFTKRAFLSGRLDLSQAEAVAEIIASKSRAALRAALAQLDGALSARVSGLKENLVGVLAELEARLDFAEDVDAPVDAGAIGAAVSSARQDVAALLEAGELGKLAREGARVVIAGRPNVGKSRLLNALVGKDRAIVTAIPGTTRDTIEEWVELGGVLLTLADTAGLRPTADAIEMEGVRRTRALIKECRLVLAVVESPSAPGIEDVESIRELAGQAPVIPVVNKIDLGGDRDGWSSSLARLGLPAYTSALTLEGIEDLKERIVERLTGRGAGLTIDAGEILLTNARHFDAMRRVAKALERAGDGLAQGLSEELLAFELGQGLAALGEITGASADDEVLEVIFSRFCIGK